jgi:hypothetical protein
VDTLNTLFFAIIGGVIGWAIIVTLIIGALNNFIEREKQLENKD